MDEILSPDQTTSNDLTFQDQIPIAYSIEFRGSASEYFRIWIVNLLLTLLTLGVYSAWAKVRTRRYFDGNTFVDDSAFEYHADPVKILKGRLLIVAIVLMFAFAAKISPNRFVSLSAIFIIFALYPWIIVRASIFNLSNTSYRNIRFGFEKDYKGCYGASVKGLFVTVLTLGIGFPYSLFLLTEFKINRSRFGSSYFKFQGEVFSLYKYYIIGILVYSASVAATGLFAYGMLRVSPGLSPFGLIFTYIGLFGAGAVIHAGTVNYVAKSTTVEDIKFSSSLEPIVLLFYYITNFLGCLFTLGFAYPWAKVRLLKYRYSRTKIKAYHSSLERFQKANHQSIGAATDAVVDFWDIDLGI